MAEDAEKVESRPDPDDRDGQATEGETGPAEDSTEAAGSQSPAGPPACELGDTIAVAEHDVARTAVDAARGQAEGKRRKKRHDEAVERLMELYDRRDNPPSMPLFDSGPVLTGDEPFAPSGIEAAAAAEAQRTLAEIEGISANLASRLAKLDPPVRTLADFAERQATMAEKGKSWRDGIKYVTAARGLAIEKAVEAHWQAWNLARGEY